MDTSTIVLAQAALAERGIRGAARLTGRPVASVAAALRRLEAEISVTLTQRAGAELVPTLEAQRLGPQIARLAELIEMLWTAGSAGGGAISFAGLERLALVIEEGSIRKAARRLGLGQPQLTRQIAQIEARMGVTLLARGTKGSAANAAGVEVGETARKILAAWTDLSHASAQRFKTASSTARLGSIMPLGPESDIARRLAQLAAQWRIDRPKWPLFIASTTAEELLAGLKSGRFDAAFLDTASPPEELESLLVARSPLALVATSPAIADGVAASLKTCPVVVPSPRSGLRQAITQVLAEALSPEEQDRLAVLEVDSIPVILNLVLHHGYVTVLPESSVRGMAGLRQVALAARHDLPLWLVWTRTDAGRRVGEALRAMLPPQAASSLRRR